MRHLCHYTGGISIHTPHRGATDDLSGRANNERFQSTLPIGERHIHLRGQRPQSAISIHTPHRGATYATYEQSLSRIHHFNPHSPSGSDIGGKVYILAPSEFQSTLPIGERPNPHHFLRQSVYFNPHSPSGSDSARLIFSPAFFNFNPHSPSGSDAFALSDFPGAGVISIHTPHRGATRKPPGLDRGIRISIHTPHRGATCSIDASF